MEEKPDMTKSQIEDMIKKEIESYRSTGRVGSLHQNFESIINKTYHKNGSLTYEINSDRLRKESDFEQGEIDALTVTEGNNDISSY